MNPGDVELRHLRCLLAIADVGTVTGAAARLGLTQPAVSRTLQQLEAAVGSRLVERSTRALHLTVAGQEFCVQARIALDAVESAVATARGLVRPLRLGFSWAAAGPHTTAILRAWRAARPDVPIEVHRVDERMAGLGRGLADVVVVRVAVEGPLPHNRPVHAELLFTEPRMAALPVGHPLAARDRVGLLDLADQTVVISSLYGTTTLDLWPVASRPTAVVESANIDEWLTTIAIGAAVGVTTASTSFQHPHPGVAFVPLDGAEDVGVFLAWAASGAHPAVRDFARVAHRTVATASR